MSLKKQMIISGVVVVLFLIFALFMGINVIINNHIDTIGIITFGFIITVFLSLITCGYYKAFKTLKNNQYKEK